MISFYEAETIPFYNVFHSTSKLRFKDRMESNNFSTQIRNQLFGRFKTTKPSNTNVSPIEDFDGELRFDFLPHEIQLYIFSFLDAVDLGRSSSVSRTWNSLTNYNLLWNHLFEREKHQWKSLVSEGKPKSVSMVTTLASESKQLFRKFTANTVFDYLSKNDEKVELDDSSNIQWKDLYLDQYLQNKISYSDNNNNSQVNSISSKFSSLFSKKVHTIPMFGEGLDNSAKQLLYQMIWKQGSPFKVNKMYPGVEGVGSGIGFTINNMQLSLSAMYKYEDRGIFDKVRPLWKEFFKNASGFVFAVDSTYTLEEAKNELYTFINDEWTSSQPLLILLTQDTEPQQVKERTPAEVAQQLELYERMKNRVWNISVVNTKTLEGVVEGFYWLASKLSQ